MTLARGVPGGATMTGGGDSIREIYTPLLPIRPLLRMRVLRTLWLLTILPVVIVACGQKGDLYRPAPTPPAAPAPPATPAAPATP